jgi:hypothetical protein
MTEGGYVVEDVWAAHPPNPDRNDPANAVDRALAPALADEAASHSSNDVLMPDQSALFAIAHHPRTVGMATASVSSMPWSPQCSRTATAWPVLPSPWKVNHVSLTVCPILTLQSAQLYPRAYDVVEGDG